MTYHLGVGLRLVVCLILGLGLGEGCVHARHDHLPPLHHQGQLVPRLPDKVLGLLVTQIEHILPVDLDQVVARLAARVTSDAIKRYLITDEASCHWPQFLFVWSLSPLAVGREGPCPCLPGA